MSGEVCLNVKLTGGRQLSVSKDGSQLTARATWATSNIESTVVQGSLTPADYDLVAEGTIAGQGDVFLDQMVRYPLLLTLNEIFAKDKKQKDEKVVTHAAFTVDLSVFMTGQKSITQKFSAVSGEIPGMIVDFELFVEIEKPFPKSFLDNDYRILSVKLVNAGNVPESWLGANFTASIPIPKANNEVQGICLGGKTDSTAIDNDVTLSWSTPDGQGKDFYFLIVSIRFISLASFKSPTVWPRAQTFGIVGAEQQNGDRVPHNKSGPMIVWNMERRVLMSGHDSDTFQDRIATFAQNLPIEIARAREPEGQKKGKGKQEENELQNHGLAMVNLSPLLYPGVKSVRGAFSVQPYTDQTMLSSGFTASIAEEMHRSGSTLQLDQRLKSGMARASNTSDLSNEKKTPSASPDSVIYNEQQTTLYLDISLSRPFVERRKLSDLSNNVAQLIPRREAIPRRRFGAEASVNEYHSVIADIGRKVLQDIRNFRQSPSNEEGFHESLMYKINKAGKYNEYHEQLKYSVIRIVREKYLKTGDFASDEEFKTFLEVLYVFLVKEMHKSLNKTVVQDAPPEPEKVASLSELKIAAMFAEKMEQPAKANYLWTELLARDDSSAECWRGLARTALLQGDIDRAHEALQQEKLQKQPDISGLKYQLPAVFYLKAIFKLIKACSLDIADPWTMILAAMVTKKRGDLYQTKVLLSRASANPDEEDQTVPESAPTNALERSIAFILLSIIYEEELNHQMTQFSALEAERIGKYYVMDGIPGKGIYLRAGEMFFEAELRGHAQEMLAHYIASLSVSVKLPGRALLLKSKLEAQESHEAALQTILEAAKINHSNPSVWAHLGLLHLKIGAIPEAKEAFIRAVTYEKSPENPETVFIRLADILAGENNFSDARKHYLMAAEVCPTAVAWTGVGVCSLRLGQLEEAEDALAEANLLDPRNPEVWGYLSLLCLQSNRQLEAEQSFKFASKLKLQNSELMSEIRQWQQKCGFGDPSY